MPASFLRRVAALGEAFDPRAILRTRQRVDEVRDSARDLRRLLETIDIRTQQLMTLERLNYQQRSLVEALPRTLDPQRVKAHVDAAVARAALSTDPCPHLVVEEWLPRDLYETVIQAIPPSVFFADKPSHKQQLNVPPAVAPEFSRAVWEFLSETVVRTMFRPAVMQKLESSLDAYLRTICPAAADVWQEHVKMHVSDGRLMLRRPGYLIEPHRDPRWGFVTCLAYLAKPQDRPAWGTQLYRVAGDMEAPDESAFYVSKERCELARDVPFVANTVLVFVNSTGAHGASIPADAEPPTLERYMYQFRIGPDIDGIRWLLARMPEAQRRFWSGLKTERAAYV